MHRLIIKRNTSRLPARDFPAIIAKNYGDIYAPLPRGLPREVTRAYLGFHTNSLYSNPS